MDTFFTDNFSNYDNEGIERFAMKMKDALEILKYINSLMDRRKFLLANSLLTNFYSEVNRLKEIARWEEN